MKEFIDSLNQIEINDKVFIVFCLTVISIVALFKLPSPDNLLTNVVSGMLGMAIGKGINQTK